MTVSKNNPVNNYAGNNSVTRFDFDFLIEDAKELLVQHTNSLGVQTTLILDKDYTINEIGNKNGSYITFPLAESDYSVLADDEIISLSLELDIEQDKEYANSSKLNFITLEWSFDYITRILQTMSRKIARSVKVQEGSTQTADQLVEALQQAQVNASASASAAVEKAVEAANSAITASEQAQIATQTASQLQSQTMQININTQNIATKATTSLNNLTADGEARFDCKVNTDGSNLTNVSNAFKAKIVNWGIPDYDSRINTGKQTPYTAPCDGLFVYSNNATDSYMGTACVNGFLVSTLRAYTTDCFPVAKNDVITLTNTPQITTTYFVPMKGEINANV